MPQPVYSHKFTTVVGTDNTQLKFSFPTYDLQDLNLYFTSAGGTLSSQSATIKLSFDEANWTNTIDTIALGTGSAFAKYYNVNSLASGASLNPLSFPYVQITVPALGLGKIVTVQISGKTARSYSDDSGGALKPIHHSPT